ncbi:MAG TPA: Gfo/Idh/MocA family oxidoreductase [Xanthobacteraceae bacterium]|jgi:predicted dehydrogenase
MASRIKIAAVGLGWVALHRHLPVMGRGADFEVVGVIDSHAGRAEAVAQQRGYRRSARAAALDEVPWLDEVDAVTVATAPMAHHALVRQALARGKHVLTEKPFAMTVVQGEDMVAAAISAGRQLAVVHNFQFARSTLRLKADIAAGVLGAITGIDAVQFGNPGRRLPDWYETLPLGLFYDESPHLLYLMRSIAGPLELTNTVVIPSRHGLATPARVTAWFKAETADYPIQLSCNFESPVSEWYLMVFGEKRLGIIDVFRDIYISLPNDGAHDTRNVLRTSMIATAQHWLQHVTSGIPHLLGRLFYGNDQVFARFAGAIRGDVAELEPVGPASALSILKLQHAIVDRRQGAPS